MTQVFVVIPVYNAAARLPMALASLVRQRGEFKLIPIVVDHGSTDASVGVARSYVPHLPELRVVTLERIDGETASPARPLNVAVEKVVELASGSETGSWFMRLDADDFLVDDDSIHRQIVDRVRVSMIMATLRFFNRRNKECIEYGPRRSHRELSRLAGWDIWAVAHHASLVRCDLLADCVSDGDLYDRDLDTGEDLSATAKLIARVDESMFAFHHDPLCYKELHDGTITEGLPLRRVLRANLLLANRYDSVSRRIAVRGFVETALERATNEHLARTASARLLGRNGEWTDVEYSSVEARLVELASDLG